MRSLVIERLASQRRVVINSINTIVLSNGNLLVVFFKEGTPKSAIETFLNFFHLEILSPDGEIKHRTSAFSAKERRSNKNQFFFKTKKIFPPIRKGDEIKIISAVPPNRKYRKCFTL